MRQSWTYTNKPEMEKAWREKNREHLRAYKKAWRQKQKRQKLTDKMLEEAKPIIKATVTLVRTGKLKTKPHEMDEVFGRPEVTLVKYCRICGAGFLEAKLVRRKRTLCDQCMRLKKTIAFINKK